MSRAVSPTTGQDLHHPRGQGALDGEEDKSGVTGRDGPSRLDRHRDELFPGDG